MIKRFGYILLFLSVICFSYGQRLSFSGWTHSYLNIYTYDGATDPEAYTLNIEYSGSNLNLPYWKLSAKLTGSILSTDGSVFPAEKISFVPVRTDGQANNPGPLPTIIQIGMPSPVLLNEVSEVFLVPSSNTALYNVSKWNSYYNLRLIFNLVVAGGAYLEPLQDKTFIVPLRFTLYRQNNSVIGTWNSTYTIQIQRLAGKPPKEDIYSIQVSTEAANGLLEFKTTTDYTQGKNITYTNGITVSSNTGYQVTVRSISPVFTSASSKTLPLDIISMQLIGGSGTTTAIQLSSSTQTILQAPSTNSMPVPYDIKYSTGANDSRLFNVQSDLYSSSLIFEISPQ